MDKLDHYRACIQALLEQYAQVGTQNEAVENELFFDTVRDHYQLMRVGWNGLSRVYHTVLHFDIKGDKIWLQQNTTAVVHFSKGQRKRRAHLVPTASLAPGGCIHG
jgi:hypothetical protein